MSLDYLNFDYSEDAHGHGSFDALAAVSPAQWPALQAEVERLLAWAHHSFGPARGGGDEAGDDSGVWDYALQGLREVPTPLALRFDARSGQLHLSDGPTAPPRLTLGLTLTGSAGFCQALRETFGIDAE
jgi:hypothetical protein